MLLFGNILYSILAAPVIFHQDDLKNWMISSISSYHPGAINPFLLVILAHNSKRGKELNKFCPPNSSDDLFFGINPSSMPPRYGTHAIVVADIGQPLAGHLPATLTIPGHWGPGPQPGSARYCTIRHKA